MKSNEMKSLTPKQEKAIAALVSAATIKDAAEQAGVTTVTLWRWLQLPEFAGAWRAARRQLVERAVSELQAATGEAVETLKRNLHCENEAVEVRAASIILEQAVKGVELIDLQERVERLETLLAEQEKGKKKWA
jgi:transposase-like protein